MEAACGRVPANGEKVTCSRLPSKGHPIQPRFETFAAFSGLAPLLVLLCQGAAKIGKKFFHYAESNVGCHRDAEADGAVPSRTLVNPLSFVKVGFSAGIDQANDKPMEWEQGASGYGKRFANILGQYSIQRTVTYGLGSALHEDNRYFNSGEQGFWPRTGYALSSGILARHDDGSLHFSISQVGGVAAGAFLARTWLPPSQSSPGDGAVSFGITMATNIGFSVMKEFLPDLGRALTRKHKKRN